MPMDPVTWFLAVGKRYTDNLKETWDELTPQKSLRLLIIVCAYLLLRPYLLKLTGKAQMEQHEREERETERRVKAAVSANEIRGMRVAAELPDADAPDVTGPSSGADWGNKARRRQREVLQKLLAAEEQRLAEQQEDEEDKDIEEFLVG